MSKGIYLWFDYVISDRWCWLLLGLSTIPHYWYCHSCGVILPPNKGILVCYTPSRPSIQLCAPYIKLVPTSNKVSLVLSSRHAVQLSKCFCQCIQGPGAENIPQPGLVLKPNECIKINQCCLISRPFGLQCTCFREGRCSNFSEVFPDVCPVIRCSTNIATVIIQINTVNYCNMGVTCFHNVSTFYWGTYVYVKSWCLYLTFKVLYKSFFVSYLRILFLWDDLYTMLIRNLSICIVWYHLCFRQGHKVEQFHWLVIPLINIFEIKNK